VNDDMVPLKSLLAMLRGDAEHLARRIETLRRGGGPDEWSEAFRAGVIHALDGELRVCERRIALGEQNLAPEIERPRLRLVVSNPDSSGGAGTPPDGGQAA